MEKKENKPGFNGKTLVIWIAALALGGALGALELPRVHAFLDFIAAGYTRLFQFIAVPTIALAVTTTVASLGAKRETGRVFLHTLLYTLLTTVVAAAVGAALYLLIAPGNLPVTMAWHARADLHQAVQSHEPLTIYGHILSVIPDNIIAPLAEGRVLSILLIAAAAGLAIASLRDSGNVKVLLRGLLGLQEVLFALIRALVWSLPLAIAAFAAQLSAQVSAGATAGSLGRYAAVILGGNLIQFFVILPLFLLMRGINPLRVFRAMLPAVLTALFTKSSAATLPVTMASAENNLKASPEVSRFVLPICCTINMNGCAAFILVTSLFVMQNGGAQLTPGTILLWLVIAVIAAVGNAGVPMGCYFLTLSLMAGIGAPLGILGVILPIYTIIDMVETAENVWSDSCVCAAVSKDMIRRENIWKDFV